MSFGEGIPQAGQDAEPKGQSLERYVPAGTIEDRQAQELALVGFSPALPATLEDLNSAITALNTRDAFEGYRFTLTPDYNKPQVDVEARYKPTATVVLEADLGKHATLSIKPISGLQFLSQATLLDLKEAFATGDLEPESAVLSVTSHQAVAEMVEPQSRPLLEVATEADLRNLGAVPTQAYVAVEGKFKESPTTLSIDMGWLDPRFTRTDDMLLRIKEIAAVGHASEIEQVIGTVATLLTKHSL